MSLDVIQDTVVGLPAAFSVHHLKKQIRPVKSRHNRHRRLKLQIPDDIPPYHVSSRGGKRTHHRSCRKSIYKTGYLQITRSEILPPLGYAVSFIHSHHRNIRIARKFEKLSSAKPFRGHIYKRISALSGIFQRQPYLILRQSAVDIRRMYTSLIECLNLIRHKRDQRRDNQRHSPFFSAQHQSRKLVTKRFAGSGWHDSKHIPAVKYSLYKFLLPCSQAVISEIVF